MQMPCAANFKHISHAFMPACCLVCYHAGPAFLQAFQHVQSEEQFFEVLQTGIAKGVIPKQLLPVWTDFYNNYKTAVLNSVSAPSVGHQG